MPGPFTTTSAAPVAHSHLVLGRATKTTSNNDNPALCTKFVPSRILGVIRLRDALQQVHFVCAQVGNGRVPAGRDTMVVVRLFQVVGSALKYGR
jgi:hypothetical protein